MLQPARPPLPLANRISLPDELYRGGTQWEPFGAIPPSEHLRAVPAAFGDQIAAGVWALDGILPDRRNRAILTLLYASGIRVGELCGLCWRNLQVNGEGGQITVWGKGSVTPAVQLPAAVWKMVMGPRGEGAGGDDPVFVSRKKRGGGRLQPLAVLRIVRAAAARGDCVTGFAALAAACACVARASEGELERVSRAVRGTGTVTPKPLRPEVRRRLPLLLESGRS
jgi:integrase